MTQLEQLRADAEDHGGTFKTLGDVGMFIRGNGLQKSDLTDEGSPAIHYGQIHTSYDTWTDHSLSFVAPERAAKLRRARSGDLVIATTSEDDAAVAKATAWLGEDEVAVSGDAYIYRHTLNPRYVAYFFQSHSFQEQKRRHITGTKVRRISGDALAKIQVPVPPPSIQEEVVDVLDRLSALQAQLEEKLYAELEARRSQHEHYKKLMFEEFTSRGVRSVPLRELGTWYGGGTPSKARADYWTNGDIPWISPKDMTGSTVSETKDHITTTAVEKSATKLVPANAVALVVRSSILNHTLPIAFVPVPAALNQDMKAVVAGDGILPKYIFHALRAFRGTLLRDARRPGGSVGSLESRRLWQFHVPVPDADEQAHAVELMEQLDTITNDLTTSLASEIAARRQQYEYYREKLIFSEESAP